MKRSSNFFALPLAALLLTGCGLMNKEDSPGPSTIIVGKPKPAKPATPAQPEPAKPEEKPALQRPVEKGDPQVRFDEALGYMKSNQAAEAEQSFLWLTQDFPKYAGPWTNLGIIYAKSNRNPQAVAAFMRAVDLNSDDATAWNWLGILYRNFRDYSRAEQAYRSALNADGDFGLAHLNLGILYDEYMKRPADALPHYKAYLRNGGKDDLRVQAWVAAIENPGAISGGAKPTSGSVEKP